ncbi:hypothetical protein CLAIMM_06542 [Cladophialophora immunda]|nr:hypothetical protein CLAIMM_06542 [Cladophialophora immunda]
MKGSYDLVPGSEEEQGLINEIARARKNKSWSKLTICSMLSNVILLAGIVMIAVFRKPADIECLRRTNAFSPILYDADIPLERVKLNGTFFPATQPANFWRQEPNPALDEAWDALAETPAFLVTADEVRKAGGDPERAVRVPESWGLRPKGDPVYFAQMDGQHSIHCLNALRMFAYFPYYFGHKWKSTAEMPVYQQNHLNHCVDMLRQNLMCSISTDIVTYEWVEANDTPQPNFSIEKVCRSRDVIWDWLQRHKLHLTHDQDYHTPRPPPGQYQEVPASPYWLDLIKASRAKGVEVHNYIEQTEI